MRLRRLSAKGIEQFSAFLDSLNTPTPQGVPTWLLDNDEMSSALESDIDVQATAFANRFELAEYLDSKLTVSGLKNVERDVALWAWLALFWFEQLCPVERMVVSWVNGLALSWLSTTTESTIGTFLASPYSIYRAHRDDPSRVLVVLSGSVSQPGEIAEQLASRQEIVTNKAAMDLATKLYIDPATQRTKKGAAGSGPGSARRFADVLNQFVLTWDLYAMQMQAMLTMMPKEFSRFR